MSVVQHHRIAMFQNRCHRIARNCDELQSLGWFVQAALMLMGLGILVILSHRQ